MFVIDRLIDWLIDPLLFDWLIDGLMDWLIVYRLFVCSIDWLIDYLLWCFKVQIFFCFFFTGRVVLYGKSDSGGASGESDPCPAQVQEDVTSPGRWASEFGWSSSSFFDFKLWISFQFCSWCWTKRCHYARGSTTGRSTPAAYLESKLVCWTVFFAASSIVFFLLFFCDFFKKKIFFSRQGDAFPQQHSHCRPTQGPVLQDADARQGSPLESQRVGIVRGPSSFFFFATICPSTFFLPSTFLLFSTFFLLSRQFERILQDTSAPQPGEDLLAALTAGERWMYTVQLPRCTLNWTLRLDDFFSHFRKPWAEVRNIYFARGMNRLSLETIERVCFFYFSWLWAV